MSDGLVEREGELARLDGAFDDALAGDGSFVVVEGPAGIGKSRLLEVARESADERGMHTLAARGGELERDNDATNGGGGNDTVITGAGRDFADGSTDNDVIKLGRGNDGGDAPFRGGTFFAGAQGGLKGDDMFGGKGDDSLDGEGGIDELNGGAGNDECEDGPGQDKPNVGCEIET